MTRLLLIEDDLTIRHPLMRALRDRGHAVAAVSTAIEGVRLVLDTQPELVVLDLGLPDLDGRELLRMVRAVSAVPVIVATAVDDEAEIVAVLDAGADDYVVKPFSAGQLDARIRAVLRRGPVAEVTDRTVVVGDLCIDPGSREVRLGTAAIDLAPREFDMLYHLASRAGQVVTKRELLTTVWQIPYGGTDKTVDVHLSWLRRKLGESAVAPRYLHTVRGVGVRLSAPDGAG